MNIKEFLLSLWREVDPVIELFIYLGIAKLISFVFGISYLQGVAIVYTYFLLSLARISAEIIRNRNR